MELRRSAIIAVALSLAVVLGVPILGMNLAVTSTPTTAHILKGDVLHMELLPPLLKRTSWYGGAVIPVKVLLTDPDDGSIVDNATVKLLVNDMPAASPGKVNVGNNFTYLGDGIYQFNLNTKPYPAGPGSAPIKIGITAMAWEERSASLELSMSLR